MITNLILGKWIRAFYKHASNNSDVCSNLIDEVLTWRKNFNANGRLSKIKIIFIIKNILKF